MKFIDEAKIEVIAGNGGAGSASMRREKFIEFGDEHHLTFRPGISKGRNKGR